MVTRTMSISSTTPTPAAVVTGTSSGIPTSSVEFSPPSAGTTVGFGSVSEDEDDDIVVVVVDDGLIIVAELDVDDLDDGDSEVVVVSLVVVADGSATVVVGIVVCNGS